MKLKFKDQTGKVKFVVEDADTQPTDIEKLQETEEKEETETKEES